MLSDHLASLYLSFPSGLSSGFSERRRWTSWQTNSNFKPRGVILELGMKPSHPTTSISPLPAGHNKSSDHASCGVFYSVNVDIWDGAEKYLLQWQPSKYLFMYLYYFDIQYQQCNISSYILWSSLLWLLFIFVSSIYPINIRNNNFQKFHGNQPIFAASPAACVAIQSKFSPIQMRCG